MKVILVFLLKWFLIMIGIISPFYLMGIWISGPLSVDEIEVNAKLDHLYSNTAFTNCEILKHKSLQDQLDLARCEVNFVEVWLLLDEKQEIVERLNLDLDEQQTNRLAMASTYQAKSVYFSYYQNQFVYHILSEDQEWYLDIEDERVLLSVKIEK